VLEDSINVGHYDADLELARVIAEQLEALAKG
jgi:hypothetical protein